MRLPRRHRYFAISLLLTSFLVVQSCSAPKWFFGHGGKYNEAATEIMRPRGGNLQKAITNLEGVVRENPTYKDSLTMLARAYYKKGRYDDSYQIVQRALVVNQKDEIAWLVLGLNQLRLGQDKKAIETLKGGLTLFSKNSSDEEYRGFPYWDQVGRVKTATRRAVLAVLKGAEEKDNVIKSVEGLLYAVDRETVFQDSRKTRDFIREYGDDD